MTSRNMNSDLLRNKLNVCKWAVCVGELLSPCDFLHKTRRVVLAMKRFGGVIGVLDFVLAIVGCRQESYEINLDQYDSRRGTRAANRIPVILTTVSATMSFCCGR